MTWVVRLPQRADFCGVVGCPLCFSWADESGGSPEASDATIAITQFAIALLQRTPTPAELVEAEKAATALHNKALAKQLYPEEPPDTGGVTVDIGMSSVQRQQAFFKQLNKRKAVVERELTCDEVAAMRSERERAAAKEKAEAATKQKEITKLAQAFQTATEKTGGMTPDAINELQNLGVPASFIIQCLQQGTCDPYAIYAAYKRYGGNYSRYGISPNTPYEMYDASGRIR